MTSREDCPLSHTWCTQHAEEGWLDVYDHERYTDTILTGGHKAGGFIIPEHRELEVHQWCIESTSGKWATAVDTHFKVKFFFDSADDILLFVLRFADEQFERVE